MTGETEESRILFDYLYEEMLSYSSFLMYNFLLIF